MFERLTDHARKAMALANQQAQRYAHEYIGTEHILLGLAQEGTGVAARVLRSFGHDYQQVAVNVKSLIKAGPDVVSIGKLPQTPRAKKVIEYAIEEARSFGHKHVGTEHLLLGLLREGQGVAWQVLSGIGMQVEQTRERVLEVLRDSGLEDDPVNPAPNRENRKAFEKINEAMREILDSPIRLPNSLEVRSVEGIEGWAWLCDQTGRCVTPPMQTDLAAEIVRRYNSFKE